LESNWNLLAKLIGTQSEAIKVTFKPDFGVHCLRLGFAIDKDKKKVQQLFATIDITMVALLDESTYSLQSYIEMEEVIFFATFDFSKELFESFIEHLQPRSIASEIQTALTSQPFKWFRDLESNNSSPFIAIHSEIGDTVHTNENESYAPFTVKRFM